MSNWILFAWLVIDVIWGASLLVATSYLVFIMHRSGWWFLLALLLMHCTGNPYKVIRKQYGVSED